ncbi:hypothetical protein ACJJTC_012112 [Scirpophaga incertulas]
MWLAELIHSIVTDMMHYDREQRGTLAPNIRTPYLSTLRAPSPLTPGVYQCACADVTQPLSERATCIRASSRPKMDKKCHSVERSGRQKKKKGRPRKIRDDEIKHTAGANCKFQRSLAQFYKALHLNTTNISIHIPAVLSCGSRVFKTKDGQKVSHVERSGRQKKKGRPREIRDDEIKHTAGANCKFQRSLAQFYKALHLNTTNIFHSYSCRFKLRQRKLKATLEPRAVSLLTQNYALTFQVK